MSSTMGEPSNRPIPTRTMPQPARLTVAQRGTSGQVDNQAITDVEALKIDLDRRKLTARKAEKWADRMMEDTLSPLTFKKAASYLNPTQYSEVSHERHLNNTCSYPACANRPQAPFSPHKRIRISWSHRSINEVEGNPEDGFCSRQCEVRSRWVEDQLEKRGVWERGVKPVELLEEVQAQYPGVGEGGERKKVGGGVVYAEKKVGRKMPDRAVSLGKTIINTNDTAVQSNETKLKGIVDGAMDTTAAFSHLTIHENPTPNIQPAPPTLSPPPAPPIKDVSPNASRRGGSSMLATPSKLTSTLLSASRQMGPMRQMDPDSEEEMEVDDHGEGAMGLTWGVEDDEMRDLFEQARLAREMEQEV